MKFKVYVNWLVYVVISVLLAIIQTSFISGLPEVIRNVDLVVVFLLVILAVSDLKTTLIYAIIAGYVMDLISFLPFGIYLLSLSFTIFLGYLLLVSYFTNRSLYSFTTLAAFTTLVYWLFLRLLDGVFSLVTGHPLHYGISIYSIVDLFYSLVLNILLSIIAFQIINFVSHRLRPVFLLRK